MRSSSAHTHVNIPMSAMIDVVFLLLVFSLVTYQDELIESHVNINKTFQKSSANSTLSNSELLEIHILPGQYLMMGNKIMDLDDIGHTLADYYRYDKDLSLLIKVDGATQHNEVIALLDQCKKIGLTNLNIAALEKG